VARSLYRRGELFGEYSRLDWDELDTKHAATVMRLPSADLDELVASLRWGRPVGYDFVSIQQINLQELAALAGEVERRCRAGLAKARLLMICDSRVVVGAVARGRSSSRVLNSRLRRLSARLLASGVELRVIWISTHFNPSGASSRHQPLPQPAAPAEWLAALLAAESDTLVAKGGTCSQLVRASGSGVVKAPTRASRGARQRRQPRVLRRLRGARA